MTMRMMMVVVVMKTAEIINSSSTFHYGIINSEKNVNFETNTYEMVFGNQVILFLLKI